VLAAVDILKQLPGYEALSKTDDLLDGIVHTARNLRFHGRWERLSREPLVLSDIGHNAHALRHNFAQLEALGRPLIIVYGIMADKDLDAILPLMPRRARYIFTTPDTPRALPADEILRRFRTYRGADSACPEDSVPLRSTPAPPPVSCVPSELVSGGPLHLPSSGGGQASGHAQSIPSVQAAVREALRMATPDTVIYIGGSTYVVAEALPLFPADGDPGHNN
jgi:dihydrofolate synthase/folylpolyglutamate synthase